MRPLRWSMRCALLLPLLALATDARAAKTDVVVLQNGDHITCEIKILQRGKLRASTDHMGTIDIEWKRIREVTSLATFEVEDLAGRLYHGSLSPGAVPGQLDIVGLSGTSSVSMSMVARIQMLKTTFWARLSGSLDAGFSYTSSSELTQFNLDGSLTYRRPSFQVEATANAILNQQPGVPDTQRGLAQLQYVRFRGHRALFLGYISATRNRELGFDLRASVGGGWGRFLLRRQSSELMAAIGLNLNREVPVEGEHTTNVEAVIGVDWAKYLYSSPKTDVEVKTLVYPSLSSWGRWRLEFNASLSQELIKDFFITLSAYESYDSDPGTESAAKNDWGVTLGLGYSFS